MKLSMFLNIILITNISINLLNNQKTISNNILINFYIFFFFKIEQLVYELDPYRITLDNLFHILIYNTNNIWIIINYVSKSTKQFHLDFLK